MASSTSPPSFASACLLTRQSHHIDFHARRGQAERLEESRRRARTLQFAAAAIEAERLHCSANLRFLRAHCHAWRAASAAATFARRRALRRCWLTWQTALARGRIVRVAVSRLQRFARNTALRRARMAHLAARARRRVAAAHLRCSVLARCSSSALLAWHGLTCRRRALRLKATLLTAGTLVAHWTAWRNLMRSRRKAREHVATSLGAVVRGNCVRTAIATQRRRAWSAAVITWWGRRAVAAQRRAALLAAIRRITAAADVCVARKRAAQARACTVHWHDTAAEAAKCAAALNAHASHRRRQRSVVALQEWHIKARGRRQKREAAAAAATAAEAAVRAAADAKAAALAAAIADAHAPKHAAKV